ncbi:biliverdin-producing heme oxygenase [Streptacidiphilus sp. PB12-B1b]|uniref:biliverdin-producing heme oxygenase n=1 Tax=Streptacidiphilus sp. PB12-B1b TaxID=2705012 RepID=UPI0015FB6D15|nr:biliverdin-producing heme oxygenase [Streptacidiphilus sp. PB12-B1b]QMU79536.1 biliverdin-producing heme oxygenase [Streptacidiphilus sp. PB12-B1b]
MTEQAAAEPQAGFAALLRSATAREHQEAEQSAFMGNLLGGRLGVDAYAELGGQLWFVYRALEDAGLALAADPVVGPFVDPALHRAPELERDLLHLRGRHWRDGLVPLPATEAYAARLREVAESWPNGFLAHHYTRYLGDLSGGQIIRGIAEKTWGFERKGDGVRFYVFEAVDNPAAFKRGYRARLDAAGEAIGEIEQRRIADESRHAFRLNTGLFHDLGGLHPLSA